MSQRQPAGIPTGGEFTANAHDEAGSPLGSTVDGHVEDQEDTDPEYEFWVGTFNDPFEYGPYEGEGSAKSVITERQPEYDTILYITQSTI